MASDLTVISVVENDRGLLDLMLRSVYKFTDPVPNIIICNNGAPAPALKKHAGRISVVKNKPLLSGGSNRHGSSLSKVFPLVKTKYTAIIESDVILTDFGWEKIRPGFVMKAAQKAKDLYHICFIVFETSVLKNMSFMPGKNSRTVKNNASYQKEFDVGWRIKEFVDSSKIDTMSFVDCKTGKGKFFGSGFQSDEFHYKGACLACHYGRGSNIKGKSKRRGFKSNEEQLAEWKKVAERIIK